MGEKELEMRSLLKKRAVICEHTGDHVVRPSRVRAYLYPSRTGGVADIAEIEVMQCVDCGIKVLKEDWKVITRKPVSTLSLAPKDWRHLREKGWILYE